MEDKDQQELFELCKQVYEVTGWIGTKEYIYPEHQNYLSDGSLDTVPTMIVSSQYRAGTSPRDQFIPLYTSDYILEKLHSKADINLYSWLGEKWRAEAGEGYYSYGGDTPRKALLKLTLALIEAGIKL